MISITPIAGVDIAGGGGSMGLLANGTVIVASDHGFLNTTGTEISPGTSPGLLLLAAGSIFFILVLTWRVWNNGM